MRKHNKASHLVEDVVELTALDDYLALLVEGGWVILISLIKYGHLDEPPALRFGEASVELVEAGLQLLAGVKGVGAVDEGRLLVKSAALIQRVKAV